MLPSPRVVERFLSWLRSKGGEFAAVGVGPSKKGGLGVIALRSIGVGEVVLKIPQSALLTVERASSDKFVEDALERASRLRIPLNEGNLALSLGLMRGSEWAPYLAMCSRDLGHLPVNWPNLDELLGGTSLHGEVTERRTQLTDESRLLNLDAQEFQWADATVSSRCFHISQGSRAMVPLADMLNTARHHERHVDFETTEDGSFVMRAIKEVSKDEELTDSYGPKSNARYLLNYGLAFADNLDGEGRSLDALCSLDVAHSSPHWIEDDGEPSAIRVRCVTPTSVELDRLVSMHRLIAATPTEFKELERHFRGGLLLKSRPELAKMQKLRLLTTIPSLSGEHETRALEALSTRLTQELWKLPVASSLNENARNAKAYVDGQRAALNGLIDLLGRKKQEA